MCSRSIALAALGWMSVQLCMLNTNGASESRFPGADHFMERFEVGSRIGMLLDRGAGSLTVYKNGRRLGTVRESGLTGKFCWAAGMKHFGDCVRMQALPCPAE